jgi:hypothetical protein
MPTDLDRSVSACAAARNLWVEPQDMKSLMSARGDNRHAKLVRHDPELVEARRRPQISVERADQKARHADPGAHCV